MSGLNARALTLTAHGHSYPLRDAPLFTPANRGPCGTRHIHARRRNRAPKLACHADRTQTCLPCEFQALQTLPPLHPHAHPHRTAQGRVEWGHKTYWRCLQRTRPHTLLRSALWRPGQLGAMPRRPCSRCAPQDDHMRLLCQQPDAAPGRTLHPRAVRLRLVRQERVEWPQPPRRAAYGSSVSVRRLNRSPRLPKRADIGTAVSRRTRP